MASSNWAPLTARSLHRLRLQCPRRLRPRSIGRSRATQVLLLIKAPRLIDHHSIRVLPLTAQSSTETSQKENPATPDSAVQTVSRDLRVIRFRGDASAMGVV